MTLHIAILRRRVSYFTILKIYKFYHICDNHESSSKTASDTVDILDKKSLVDKFEDFLTKETNQIKLKQYSSNLFKWLKNHFEDMQTSQGLFPSVKWLVTIAINCTQSATKQNKNHRNLTKNFNVNNSW